MAPDGCTQYFWGQTTDTVKTYNFSGGQHLASQDQNICVRFVCLPIHIATYSFEKQIIRVIIFQGEKDHIVVFVGLELQLEILKYLEQLQAQVVIIIHVDSL